MVVRTSTRSWIHRALGASLALAVALTVAFAGTASASGGSRTTLALDPGTASALTSLGVSVAPVAPATAGPDGVSFPVSRIGGSIFKPSLTVSHRGGLALSAGPTTVSLTDYKIVIDRSPDLVATVNGGPRVSILDLNLSKARLGFSSGALTLGPVKATLTQDAATALNGAFNVNAFTKGLVLGTATVKLGR